MDAILSLLNHPSAANVFLAGVAISVIGPVLVELCRNVSSPLFSIPGPLINKLSAWPLTLATFRGASHHFTRTLHRKYGPIVVLAPNMIAVSDPLEIKRIVQTEDWHKSHAVYVNFRQDPQRPTLIAFTDKRAYAQRKRLVSSMFGIKYIQSMEPLMNECVREAVSRLRKECDRGKSSRGDAEVPVDMQNLIHSLAIDIIGITTFGGSFHVVENGAHPLPTRLKSGLKLAGLALLIPWIRRLPFLPTRDPYVESFTHDIVETRRQVIKSASAAPRPDMLQRLVESIDESPGSHFRASDVQDETVVLLTAGSETTANAELFTLIMLLKHPDCLQKAYEEVDRWYPPTDPERETDCSYSQTGMKYLQACIDEAMRLVPGQATGSPRENSKDETVLGYRIPRGTTVFPVTQDAHMDERFWAEPAQYIPQRWLEIAAKDVPYLPFSAGSRVCIGKHFALQEMHLTLVTLLRNFEFKYIPGQDETTVFRVAQQLGVEKYMMRVKRRDRKYSVKS